MVLSTLFFLIGFLYMVAYFSTAFGFAIGVVCVLGAILKNLFFPKKNDELGPLV